MEEGVGWETGHPCLVITLLTALDWAAGVNMAISTQITNIHLLCAWGTRAYWPSVWGGAYCIQPWPLHSPVDTCRAVTTVGSDSPRWQHRRLLIERSEQLCPSHNNICFSKYHPAHVKYQHRDLKLEMSTQVCSIHQLSTESLLSSGSHLIPWFWSTFCIQFTLSGSWKVTK